MTIIFIYACMYTNSMTKVISISDDVYADLSALKSKNESFSIVIRRLSQGAKMKNLLNLAGTWKDATEMDGIFKKIIEERHKTKSRKVVL